MNGKPESKYPGWHHMSHACNRHHDLTILLKNAKKEICNHCFATLKKSYYNVIAGMLLEQQYLHNMTGTFVAQIQGMTKLLQQQETHLLNLTHEIAEIKNNGRSHENPRPEPPDSSIPDPAPQAKNQPSSDAKGICTEGHVAKVAHSLQDLLHVQIARVLQSWKKKKPEDTPASDDHQDRKGNTHTHGGFAMP